MSQFDPDAFMSSTTDAPMSTEGEPVPEGEYNAVILDTEDAIEAREVQLRDGGTAHVMDVRMRLDAPDTEAADGRVVKYSAWLDLNEAGHMETGQGKNIKVGRLREAVGQNVPGQPWGPQMLKGQPLRVSIKHSKDGRFSNVDNVAKLG